MSYVFHSLVKKYTSVFFMKNTYPEFQFINPTIYYSIIDNMSYAATMSNKTYSVEYLSGITALYNIETFLSLSAIMTEDNNTQLEYVLSVSTLPSMSVISITCNYLPTYTTPQTGQPSIIEIKRLNSVNTPSETDFKVDVSITSHNKKQARRTTDTYSVPTKLVFKDNGIKNSDSTVDYPFPISYTVFAITESTKYTRFVSLDKILTASTYEFNNVFDTKSYNETVLVSSGIFSKPNPASSSLNNVKIQNGSVIESISTVNDYYNLYTVNMDAILTETKPRS